MYHQKLGALEVMILELISGLGRHLQAIHPSRPGFRDSYDVSFSDGRLNQVAKDHADSKNKYATDMEVFVKDRLDFLVCNITILPDTPLSQCHASLFDCLDQHLASSMEDRARLDENYYRKISHLAALHEILGMIRYHRPRPLTYTIEEISALEPGRVWNYIEGKYPGQVWNNKLGAREDTHDCKLEEQQLDYSLLERWLKRFMDNKSSTGKKDKLWLDSYTAQQKAQSAFWSSVRSQHRKLLDRHNFDAEDVKADMELLSYDLSPDHVASMESQRQEILRSIAPPAPKLPKARKLKPLSTLAEPLPRKEIAKSSDLSLDASTSVDKGSTTTASAPFDSQKEWGTTPEHPKPTTEAKVKSKTRATDGNVGSVEQGLAALALPDEDPPEVQPVPVKKAAHLVFKAMLSSQETSKSVTWQSFIAAMASVGLKARHSGGSAVLFEPTEESQWYGKGKIVIHRPHPDSKLDPVMLTSIGKRMRKWFGWSADSFILASKQ